MLTQSFTLDDVRRSFELRSVNVPSVNSNVDHIGCTSALKAVINRSLRLPYCILNGSAHPTEAAEVPANY